MSDFDERLTALLTSEADDAPDAAGLAQAARRRHVVRRRRRIAVGGVAAALAVAAPVAVLAGGDKGDDNLVGDDQTSASGEWQTVGQDNVRADVPGGWSKFTCDFDGFTTEIYGPNETDACDFHDYVAFYASATFDPLHGPGEITSGEDAKSSGYVYAGDLAVSVGADGHDLVRRILASARITNDPELDVTEWQQHEGVGIRFDLPLAATLGPVADPADFFVCVAPGGRNDAPSTEGRQGVEGYYTQFAFTAGRWVSVTAPTQALRDLVTASVEAIDPGSPDRPIGCVS